MENREEEKEREKDLEEEEIGNAVTEMKLKKRQMIYLWRHDVLGQKRLKEVLRN